MVLMNCASVVLLFSRTFLHYYVPLSLSSKQYNLAGQQCPVSAEMTVGLALHWPDITNLIELKA